MQIETLVVGQLATNCYLVYCEKTGECLIVDPGDDAEYIVNRIKDLDLKPKAVIVTHGHSDHFLAATELKLIFKIPFYLHKKDLPADPMVTPDKFLKEGVRLNFGEESLKVLETPGHTQGSISLYDGKKNLFVGDTIFAHGGYGRTDLRGGDSKKIDKSIKKLFGLPKKVVIYPGHGEPTTVGDELEFWKDR